MIQAVAAPMSNSVPVRQVFFVGPMSRIGGLIRVEGGGGTLEPLYCALFARRLQTLFELLFHSFSILLMLR